MTNGVAGVGVVSFSQAAGGGRYTAVKGRNETLKCSVRGISHHTVQYSAVHYSTVQYSTVQYSTVQYNTVQYRTVSCNRGLSQLINGSEDSH